MSPSWSGGASLAWGVCPLVLCPPPARTLVAEKPWITEAETFVPLACDGQGTFLTVQGPPSAERLCSGPCSLSDTWHLVALPEWGLLASDVQWRAAETGWTLESCSGPLPSHAPSNAKL